MKIILTGATGLVGEGVLLECLDSPQVTQVLMINRRSSGRTHPKLNELIVSDFFKIDQFSDRLIGYDACFYCAGISSVGLNEEKYTYITYDTTMYFAARLAELNPGMVFNFISGQQTDSSEKGRVMWARVKGKTENALKRLPFRRQYSFRPGIMEPVRGQQNVRGLYKVIAALFPVLRFLFPRHVITLTELGDAMINAVLKGYPKQILEVSDIKELSHS